MSTKWAIVSVAILGLFLAACCALFIIESSASAGSMAVAVILAIAIAMIASRLSAALVVGALESLGVIIPVAAFIITCALIGSQDGTIAFHEIGAQLIVVLLLALALEARFFGVRDRTERFDLLVPLYVMALLAVGEFYALRSLLSEEPRGAEMVGGAIAAGFAAVAVSALLGPTKRSSGGE